MRRVFLFALALMMPGAVGTRASAEIVVNDNGPGEADTSGVIGEEIPRELADVIVVTANRFGLEPAKSVWPVTAIDLQEIGAGVSLESALDGTSGVDIRQSSGEGSLASLSSWGMFNRHMLLLYDGRVVKDYSLGGFNLSDYSAEEFERIELLKGPQSAFYGADAVGGVVNLISRSFLVDRLALTAKTDWHDLRLHRLDLSRKIGLFGAGGFAEFSATDNTRANSGSERALYGARADYLSSDGHHRLSVSGRYFEDSLGVPGPVPDPEAVPIYGSDEAWSLFDHQKDDNYSVDVRYHFCDERFGEAILDAFWEKKNLDYNSLYNYPVYYFTYDTSGGSIDSVQNIDSVDVDSRSVCNKRSAGINGRYLKQFARVSVAGGIDWLSGSIRATQHDISTGANIVGPFAPFEYRYESYSFWSGLQDQFDLWSAVAYDALNTVRADFSGRLQLIKGRKRQPSYNLGMIYRPASGVSVKVGYGYAFRLPTIAEQFADGFYTLGNAELSPETSRSLIGTAALATEDSRFSARFTIFRQTVDSLIQYRFDYAAFRSVPINVERFMSKGIDFALGYRLFREFGLSLGLVYQDAEQTTENGLRFARADYVPDLKWRVDFDGRLASALSYNANVIYTSDRSATLYGGSSKTIENVYELGMSVSVEPAPYLKLVLTGLDLTDQKRPDQFGFTSGDGDYPTPGRRFFAKAVVEVL